MVSSKATMKERFPIEIAYVDSNWEQLVKDYPDKLLVIEGNQVVRAVGIRTRSVGEWLGEEFRQSFICSTEKPPVFCPPRPGIIPHV